MNLTHAVRGRTLLAPALLLTLCGVARGQCLDQVFGAFQPQDSGAFGDSLAVSGDWLFAGASGSTALGQLRAGVVDVFHRTNGGPWLFSQSIHAPSPTQSGSFGDALDADGGWLVIGNRNYSPAGNQPSFGQLLVLQQSGNNWLLTANLAPPSQDAAPYANFGQAVSVRGNRIAVGSSAGTGAVVVYRYTGSAWQVEQRITNPNGDSGAGFGQSVSIDGGFMIVGAPNANTAVPRSGVAYVYKLTGGTWGLVSGISGDAQFGALGSRVRVRNDTFGALQRNTGGLKVMRTQGSGFSGVVELGNTVGAGTAYATAFDIASDGGKIVVGEGNSPFRVDTWDLGALGWTRSGTVITSRDPDLNTAASNVALVGDHVAVGMTENRFGGYSRAGVAIWAALPYREGGRTCADAAAAGFGEHHGCTGNGALDGLTVCQPTGVARAAWYRFDPPCPGLYTIDTVNSNFDTVLSVFDGCPDAGGAMVACNDDFPGLGRQSRVQVRVGGPVLIRVCGYVGAEGLYQLNISLPQGPANDTCDTAVVTSGYGARFCNTQATDDGLNDLACTGSGTMHNDVWYSYTPACSGLYTFSACDADFDTVMALYEGGCAGVGHGPVACNDDSDACGLRSVVSASLVEGTEYLLRIGGYAANSLGSGTLYIYGNGGCPADYNADGGVDGADVSDFFNDWEGGSFRADVNCDGGVDGSDVSVFYAAWENGGC